MRRPNSAVCHYHPFIGKGNKEKKRDSCQKMLHRKGKGISNLELLLFTYPMPDAKIDDKFIAYMQQVGGDRNEAAQI